MSTSRKTTYVIGQRPPATLTAKAREQLENAKPSLQVAALAKIAAKLISTSSNGVKFISIPKLKCLQPNDLKNALTAKDAAGAARNSTLKTSSRKKLSGLSN